MKPADRIVTELPLTELWTEDGAVMAERGRFLDRVDVIRLVLGTSVRFIIADVGRPLRWIQSPEHRQFWKADLRDHLIDHADRALGGHIPRDYFYIASEWALDDIYPMPTVVLECYH